MVVLDDEGGEDSDSLNANPADAVDRGFEGASDGDFVDGSNFGS